MGISRSFISVAERLTVGARSVGAALTLIGLVAIGSAASAQAQPDSDEVTAFLESDRALAAVADLEFFGADVSGFGPVFVIHTFPRGFFGSGGTTPDPLVASDEFISVIFAGSDPVGLVRVGESDGEVTVVGAEDAAEAARALATHAEAHGDDAEAQAAVVWDPQGEGWLVREGEKLTTLSATPQPYTLAEYSEREARGGGASGLGPLSILQDPRVLGSIAALVLAVLAGWLIVKRQKARLR